MLPYSGESVCVRGSSLRFGVAAFGRHRAAVKWRRRRVSIIASTAVGRSASIGGVADCYCQCSSNSIKPLSPSVELTLPRGRMMVVQSIDIYVLGPLLIPSRRCDDYPSGSVMALFDPRTDRPQRQPPGCRALV